MMIRVRDIFQAKFGKVGEVLELMKRMTEDAPPGTPAAFREARLLTDRSGPFFTLVIETEFESMAEWEAAFDKLMSGQGVNEMNDRMNELVRSGHREFYRIER
jgi:hypothetical protein